MRVAVVSTHPIQYHTPWFRELSRQNLELKVYYALLPDERQQGVGFGEAFAWDIPLLDGYEWELIPNKKPAPNLQGFFGSSTPEIHKILAKAKPDALIITGWQSLPLLQALWAANRLEIPRIVRGDSNALRSRPRLVRGLHRFLLSRFDAFLATGKLNREFYVQYGVENEHIFSSRHFVDNKRFAEQHQREMGTRQTLRAAWNINEGQSAGANAHRVCFLFAGKLEPKKRIMDLLRAADIASRSNSKIHLLVVGTGELMEEARQLAESRSLPVTFTGFLNQTEITRAYAAADCLVLPSDFGETWGLVVNEAMACGLPAIVSDRVGCGPDLVTEGVTGSVFPCGDISALASKLVEFGSSREKLVRMGEQASHHIKAYSVEAAVEGTMQAIEFVTKVRRRPAIEDRATTEDPPTTLDGPRTTGEMGATANGRRSPVTGQ